MSHACVGMPETRRKPMLMPTQAWSMAPIVNLVNRNYLLVVSESGLAAVLNRPAARRANSVSG